MHAALRGISFLICDYVTIHTMSVHQLYEAVHLPQEQDIYRQLINEQNSLPASSVFHPIRDYPARVSMAGQLSTPG
jgi:hypothetical protein